MEFSKYKDISLDGNFGTDLTNDVHSSLEENAEAEENFQLDENIFMFPKRTIGEHGNVYEGEVRSSVYGVRPCVIKFAALSEQIVREAEILTKLGSHTNVIAMIQSGTFCDVFDERVYLALDKCHNENLRQYLANRKAAGIEFDLNQAIDFAKQIIAGVTYIHDNNVIHLDLKPSNILISQNLHLIKIADFGLSIIVKSPKSKILHKRQFGTNGYRPVESFGNGEVSQRTDIFSLGTVLLHLLSNGNEVFGHDEHIFIHNVMNDITNTSGLLVPNPNTTEHLMKCMVSKERCRRPNIWEVSDHPCWSGKEAECQFEYLANDERDDDMEDSRIIQEEEMTSLSDMERGKQFLKKMRELGFNRKPAIIVFDFVSGHLHHFDHRSNVMRKMHKCPTFCSIHSSISGILPSSWDSSAVVFGEHIYIFQIGMQQSVYRLEYGDATATWTRMADNQHMAIHLYEASFVASPNAIFVVGGARNHLEPTRSVSKYDPVLDEWTRLNEKPNPVSGAALLCHKGFLYCFGGEDEMGMTNNTERLNLTTMQWMQLTSMNHRRSNSSAAEFEGKIYLLGGSSVDAVSSVEIYDTVFDQWTNMNPTLRPHLLPSRSWVEAKLLAVGKDINSIFMQEHLYFRSFWIDGKLFSVSRLRAYSFIEKYDPVKDERKIVAIFPEMRFDDCVLVSMSM